MSAVMQVERLHFCFVHGYAHPDGEMEDVNTIPIEFFTGAPDEPGEVVVEPCHEEEWDVVVLDDGEYDVTNEEAVLTQNNGVYTLKAGDLAYIYTVRGGLVPCKVLKVDEDGRTEVRVTADRLGWARGATEVLRNPHVSLVSRSQVSYRQGQPRVNGALAMVTDDGKVIR